MVVEYTARRWLGELLAMCVQGIAGRRQTLKAVEAVSLVRYHQNQPAAFTEQALALDQEANQIRRVPDDMTGDNPLVTTFSTDGLR
jgi:hypothetical protein